MNLPVDVVEEQQREGKAVLSSSVSLSPPLSLSHLTATLRTLAGVSELHARQSLAQEAVLVAGLSWQLGGEGQRKILEWEATERRKSQSEGRA